MIGSITLGGTDQGFKCLIPTVSELWPIIVPNRWGGDVEISKMLVFDHFDMLYGNLVMIEAQ